MGSGNRVLLTANSTTYGIEIKPRFLCAFNCGSYTLPDERGHHDSALLHF